MQSLMFFSSVNLGSHNIMQGYDDSYEYIFLFIIVFRYYLRKPQVDLFH